MLIYKNYKRTYRIHIKKNISKQIFSLQFCNHMLYDNEIHRNSIIIIHNSNNINNNNNSIKFLDS
jgi:hypothetical protein